MHEGMYFALSNKCRAARRVINLEVWTTLRMNEVQSRHDNHGEHEATLATGRGRSASASNPGER